MGHLGRSNEKVQGQRRIGSEGSRIGRSSGEAPSAIGGTHGFFLADGRGEAFRIDFLHLLNDLKQTGAAWNPKASERRRNGKADGLFCPGSVSHHEIGGQRIQSPLNGLKGGVVAFQIDGDVSAVCIGALRHSKALLSAEHLNIVSAGVEEPGIGCSSF